MSSVHPATGEHQLTYRDETSTEPMWFFDWVQANEIPAADAERVESAVRSGEKEHRSIVELDVALADSQLSVGVARRAAVDALATVRGAVALTKTTSAGLSKQEAIDLVSTADVEQLLHASFDGPSNEASQIVASGLGASPGVGVGAVYFSADDAFEAFMRGENVILVSHETSPADIHGMEIASGILTTKGGLASHAAVVARGWGIPAIVGISDVELTERSFRVGKAEVAEGDVISIDGSTGDVRIGQASVSASEPPAELFVLLEWADEIRGPKAQIRANADNADDAAKARQFGAEGIGLCRTEHMFLGKRLPVIQRMIVASSAEEESAALQELGELQRADFVELLEAMDGLPVTVRLLDPPLHEFLPTPAEIDDAKRDSPGDATLERLMDAASDWQESNPMLGTRGVRLAVLKPALYKMQTNALAQAALERSEAGGDPQIEIMIPLVVDRSEIELVRSWIDAELDLVLGDAALRSQVQIGAMIETPRAALCAGDMAMASDFFSFGTNDLTQMTFGFSRDDIEARLMTSYLEQGLLEVNPFHILDRQGVGVLIEYAVQACKSPSRSFDKRVKLGACGEHGGEPDSISFLLGAGLDYVSCSPYRVPVARLAAAKFFIEQTREQS